MEQQTQQKTKKNPRESANIFSILTFFWTVELFRTGHKKELEVDDLYSPQKGDDSGKLGDRLEKAWSSQLLSKSKSQSLIKAIASTFWREFTALGLFTTVNDIIVRIALSLFLGRLLDYFSPNSTAPKSTAYIDAGTLLILTAINVIAQNQFLIKGYTTGMKVRLATCSLIYRKSLRLSGTALGNTSVGKIVNLLSNDVSRFDLVSLVIHYLWLAPLLTVIVGVILYLKVGAASLYGMLTIVVVTSLQSYTGKLASKFRLATAISTDSRIRLMDEIVNGIEVIKLYAWEKSFKRLIGSARDHDLKHIRRSSYVRALYMTFMLFTTRSALFCTMLAIVVLGEELTASKVFVISSLYQIISSVLSQMFVRGIAEVAEALVAVRRLQSFLELDEKVEVVGATNPKSSENNQSQPILSMENVTCRWKGNSHDTLDKINLKIQPGSLIGIIGHVGSGKSSLLQSVLKELPIDSGKMSVNGLISFAPQESWIFSGSIRQNILFGSEMNADRYAEVVDACDLLKDFQMFPFGDETLIGERGSSLSGGQKARLSLARSLYRVADLYLLDDPLSAVDAHVGRHLFDECLSRRGFLGRKKATRLLVTHQVHFLKKADWIVLMKDGRVERQGCASEILEDENSIKRLADEQETIRHQSFSRSSSRISESYSLLDDEINFTDIEFEEPATEQQVKQFNNEESSKGKVSGSVALNYLKSGGNAFKVSSVFALFLLTQAFASTSDYFVSFWTNQEENNSGSADFRLAYIGGGLIVGLLVIAIVRSIYFYSITIAASRKLHQVSFDGVISTKMRFFDLNPSGRILNRFSKDLGSIDELLPKCLLDSTQVILTGIGSIVVTAIINPLFLIPIGILFAIFAYLQKYFLKTSKSLKRLEGITRSPAFVHLAATINGLSTVRAFNAQEILKKEFDQHQNLHTGAFFLYINASQAFGFTLDIFCLIFVIFVTMSFLVFESTMSMSSATVGLAITQSMSLTNILQWGIRQTAEVMNQMMAVERVLEYRELEPEQQEVKKVAEKSWPADGKVEFKSVSYRYAKEMEPALKDVTFVVNSGEKIGIVGRTGAGKSSLIGAVFRMAEIEGEILIDNVDTSFLGLEQLRSKVSIIPQDPVIFSGTLRKNLDPFDNYDDNLLWKALEAVKLKDIENLKIHGLQTPIATGGSNLSVGQRQLMCLARAILRQNKILVLDEATANVDPETDALIQQTIRDKFIDCTVLTIAHRLHTVMDSDKILVMDFGKVAEFDAPENLLKIEDGIFAGMIKATGAVESKSLISMVKKNV